jgi:hypothetical protein
MQYTLGNTAFTDKQIDSVYRFTMERMKKVTTKYREEVKLGKSKRALLKWNAYILENLDIDNVKLFPENDEK